MGAVRNDGGGALLKQTRLYNLLDQLRRCQRRLLGCAWPVQGLASNTTCNQSTIGSRSSASTGTAVTLRGTSGLTGAPHNRHGAAIRVCAKGEARDTFFLAMQEDAHSSAILT
jgi:hypothetical protein